MSTEDSGMGIPFIEGEVSSNGTVANRPVLVDSGASYSLLAEEDWQALGLEPKRTASFELADGTLSDPR